MDTKKKIPPKYATRFLRWFLKDELTEEVQGDLEEQFYRKLGENSPPLVKLNYWYQVLRYLRPFAIRNFDFPILTQKAMFQNYLKVGWRNLLKYKGYSLLNIGGFATGMMIFIFIGLWIYDELSYNKYFKNYDFITQIWQGGINPSNHNIDGGYALQYPVAATLRNNYPQYFDRVIMTWWINEYTIEYGDKKFRKVGEFIEEGGLEMLTLKMLSGSYQSLHDPHSIILSKSTAESIFGNDDPVNKMLRIDNKVEVVVTGIYEDISANNSFSELDFFLPWSLLSSYNEMVKNRENDWDNHMVTAYAQLRSDVDIESANAGIKDLYKDNMPPDFFKTVETTMPFVQLIPMKTWHLFSEFKDGEPVGGRIAYVRLFALIGILILMLACINFVNLSTARAERRSREIGLRKAVGSSHGQLVSQFLSESFVTVCLSFVLSSALFLIFQKWFNQISDKNIILPWSNIGIWGLILSFLVFTAFLAGIYPAFYLSSIKPIRILKGKSRNGKYAVLSRKILIVFQFTVSISLFIGTAVIYKQVQHTRNRPVGYSREGLLTLRMRDPDFKAKLKVLKSELQNSGVVTDIAVSSSPLTQITNTTGRYNWEGKSPEQESEFVNCNVSPEFGTTIGWEIVAGRDFSQELSLDTVSSIIINESAAKYMGLVDPIGKELIDVDEFGKFRWSKTIIGVVKDIVMESPYEHVMQTIYYYNRNSQNVLLIRINPSTSIHSALPQIKAVFDKVLPSAFFDFSFVSEEYSAKFKHEERIGILSGIFSILAIFISCLGLVGLSSYMTEIRTKEIGIRKSFGASVFSIYKKMSFYFLILVFISSFIAIPISVYIMTHWLHNYEYRTSISLWVPVSSVTGALIVTLLTVSFQAIKASFTNPVECLRSE